MSLKLRSGIGILLEWIHVRGGGAPPPPPPSATMTGHIIPELAIPYNLVIRFFTPGTDTEVMKAAATPDAAGDFTIGGIIAGIYDVGVKAQNTLSLLAASETFTDGNTTDIVFGAIRGGDLNEDDIVDGVDFGILSFHMGQWGPCCGYAGDWSLP